MLIILKDLMHRAYVETEGEAPKREPPKPCEYFDLIAGTGTGGLIAIMLGRLRLDLDTCMDVYVRMTRKVFETDKTIAGIPYKQTLFKASKLEEAIRQCVREHTVYEDEGNDGTSTGGKEFGTTISPISPSVRRSMSVRSQASVTSPQSQNRTSLISPGPGFGPNAMLWGNPEASLYDDRPHRTKTAVTAVYKGTPKQGTSVLLRSYDSRKEPGVEPNCTIWQAGRATCATGLAFKPIQIGQSVFNDEGAGKYNPAPQILEEACSYEWPGRELGMFVSVGTGKRPGGTNHKQHEWWEGFVGGSVGNFAEARRRLISKIEACEDTHIQMINQEFPKRGIPLDNYCRLNVEVGVGEFGMNEWDRLSEMTHGTQQYLAKQETREMLHNAARKLAKIQLAHKRMSQHVKHESWASNQKDQLPLNSQHDWPAAVELPAEPTTAAPRPPNPYPQVHFRPAPNPPYPADDRSYTSRGSSQDRYMSVNPSDASAPPRRSVELSSYSSQDKFSYTPPDYRTTDSEPPPRPPKTPINDVAAPNTLSAMAPPTRTSPMTRPNAIVPLPYPVDDTPPPVNKLRKPQYTPM